MQKKSFYIFALILIPVSIFLIEFYFNVDFRCSLRLDNSQKYCFNDAAQSSQDPKLCEKIIDEIWRVYCLTALAATKDPNICEKEPSSWKGNCYYEVSRKGDTRLCDKITSSQFKDGCYYTIALIDNDSSLCNKILDNDLNMTCSAITKSDSSLCESVSEFRRPDCYSDVASKLLDSNICKKIDVTIKMDICYLNIAQKTKSSTLCQAISNQTIQKVCLSQIS